MSAANSEGKVNHVCELLKNISGLLENSENADVTFLVGEAKIPAHRNILACQSEYFRSMLYGGLREGSEKEVKIRDTNPDTFRRLLRYFYTRKLSLGQMEIDVILDLFKLAHLFQEEKLQMEIELYLESRVCIENFYEMLDNASLYSLQKLLSACLTFSDAHTVEVIQCHDFITAPIERIEQILARNTVTAPEIEIFKAVQRWLAQHIMGERERDHNGKERILKLVQLAMIDEMGLLTTVRESKLFGPNDILDALSVQKTTTFGAPRIESPTENVATLDKGALVITADYSFASTPNVLIDGSRTSVKHRIPSSEGITVKLGRIYTIGVVGFTLWHFSCEIDYSYYVETSIDGQKWTRVDRMVEHQRSEQIVRFPEHPVRYIRVVGTACSEGDEFYISRFHCFS
ncbi:hypothetical protein QR680_013998 [Steinernema hermaphroditum]|nr:hypothetical protein QR680_013998 [Steinernema hermaphroditum]